MIFGRLSRNVFLTLLVAIIASATACPANALDPSRQLTQYGYRTWRVGDAGLDSAPLSVAQTPDGYIWVGTGDGLYRFDGIKFERFHLPGGVDRDLNQIAGLFGARDGSLYIGSAGGLGVYAHGRFRFISRSMVNAREFKEARDGTVWIGFSGSRTAGSFCSVKSGVLRCVGEKEGVRCPSNYGLDIGPDGAVWVGGEQGICEWSPTANRFFPMPATPGSSSLIRVRAMAVGRDGGVWAGSTDVSSNKGLARLTSEGFKSYRKGTFDGSKLQITKLAVDREGGLWAGAQDGGILRLFQDRVDRMGKADGLAAGSVTAIMQDQEGSMWIVTDQGITELFGLRVAAYTTREGLSGSGVETVAAMPDGDLAISNSGAIDVIRHGASVPARMAYNPNKFAAYALADSRGRLWISGRGGVRVLSSDRKEHIIPFPADGADDNVLAAAEDAGGDIWLAQLDLSEKPLRGLIRHIHEDRVVETLTSPAQATDRAKHPAIDQLHSDGTGGLWVGVFKHGLYHLRDHRFARVGGIRANAWVTGLETRLPGEVWVATLDGVTWAKEGQARTLSLGSGLPCGSAYAVKFDSHADLWVALQCGLVRLRGRDLDAWIAGHAAGVRPVDFIDAPGGFSTRMGMNSPTMTRDGRLWFIGQSDLRMIDPSGPPIETRPPPVTIERVVADFRPMGEGPTVRVPQRTHQLEIAYTAPSFVRPDAIRFTYQLVGYDQEPQSAGARRSAFYNDLPPGRYLFKISACNGSGLCSPVAATITIELPPAWWQTWWFKTLAGMTLVALIGLAARQRLTRYARTMQLRFDERLSERTRVARDLHDSLMQTVLASKMVADDATDTDLDATGLRSVVARLARYLDRAAVEARAAIDALRVMSVETDDLIEVLEPIAHECVSVGGGGIEFAFATRGAVQPMHPAVRDEIFKIGSEAIRNACLHSGGRSLTVEVDFRRRLTLNIADDGKGIPPAILAEGREGHFGLPGMRERAAAIGAQLHIRSGPDGTRLRLTVPAHVAFLSPPKRRFERWFRFLESGHPGQATEID